MDIKCSARDKVVESFSSNQTAGFRAQNAMCHFSLFANDRLSAKTPGHLEFFGVFWPEIGQYFHDIGNYVSGTLDDCRIPNAHV